MAIDCSKTVNFLQEYNRMCNSFNDYFCNDCPMYKHNNGELRYCENLIKEFPDRAVEIVQKWSDEHQPKTRLDDILEKFPHIDLNRVDKVPYIRPFNYGYCKDCNKCTLRAKASVDTAYCWNEPVNGGATGKAVK